jgi:plastocyanin
MTSVRLRLAALIVPTLVAGVAAGPPLLPGAVRAAASAPAATPATAHVSLREFAFQPATLTVTAGTAVTWTYDESATDPAPNCESLYFRTPVFSCPGHSVTSFDSADDFDSHIHRAEGYPFSHVFRAPGRYRYFCQVHGGTASNNPLTHMDADIVVLPATGSR